MQPLAGPESPAARRVGRRRAAARARRRQAGREERRGGAEAWWASRGMAEERARRHPRAARIGYRLRRAVDSPGGRCYRPALAGVAGRRGDPHMPELGNKFECFSCGAKFYDLGKPEPICPKCGANQRDAKKHEAQHETSHAKRRKREEPVRAPVEERGDPDSRARRGVRRRGDRAAGGGPRRRRAGGGGRGRRVSPAERLRPFAVALGGNSGDRPRRVRRRARRARRPIRSPRGRPALPQRAGLCLAATRVPEHRRARRHRGERRGAARRRAHGRGRARSAPRRRGRRRSRRSPPDRSRPAVRGRRAPRSPALELPHPRLRTRRFVLAPLADLAPDLPLPPDGATPRALLAALPERPWARRWSAEDGVRR